MPLFSPSAREKTIYSPDVTHMKLPHRPRLDDHLRDRDRLRNLEVPRVGDFHRAPRVLRGLDAREVERVRVRRRPKRARRCLLAVGGYGARENVQLLARDVVEGRLARMEVLGDHLLWDVCEPVRQL